MMGGELPDLYDLWDYSDPAGTRAAFEDIIPHAQSAGDTAYYLELLTQIARTWGLEANFAAAHELLDTVEAALTPERPRLRVRYLLERGRAFNSDKQASVALPLFVEAYELSERINEDFYAVDAAHMVAIAATDPEEKEKWNLTGIAEAERAADPRTRKWLGSLTNNMGWDYFSAARYDDALRMFEQTLAFFTSDQPNPQRANIARWSIAKTYRLLGRIDEALRIQTALYDEYQKAGTPDGYVSEELGELYLAQGDSARAQGYFAAAYRQLSQDTWLMRNESERLQRLKELGAVSDGAGGE